MGILLIFTIPDVCPWRSYVPIFHLFMFLFILLSMLLQFSDSTGLTLMSCVFIGKDVLAKAKTGTGKTVAFLVKH